MDILDFKKYSDRLYSIDIEKMLNDKNNVAESAMFHFAVADLELRLLASHAAMSECAADAIDADDNSEAPSEFRDFLRHDVCTLKKSIACLDDALAHLAKIYGVTWRPISEYQDELATAISEVRLAKNHP